MDASLLHEVSRVQHDKTIQAVRDLVDSIETTEPDQNSYSWSRKARSASSFKEELIAGLIKMREL